MDVDAKSHIWVLTRTEHEGQCTGFPSETVILGIFHNKPSIEEVAPFLGDQIKESMGEAIAQVTKLLNTGGCEAKADYFDFDLSQTPVGVRLVPNS